LQGIGLRLPARPRDGAPRGRLRITDKLPFNFFQLGFAALLFPQARVIHCRRDARDNVLVHLAGKLQSGSALRHGLRDLGTSCDGACAFA